MKKIIFMFVLLFAPLIVKAECSTDEVIRLKSLASKISITYDYTEKNGYISFSATFHNVHKDLKLIDVTNKEYSSNEEFIKIFEEQILDDINRVNLSNKVREVTVNNYSWDKIARDYVDALK